MTCVKADSAPDDLAACLLGIQHGAAMIARNVSSPYSYRAYLLGELAEIADAADLARFEALLALCSQSIGEAKRGDGIAARSTFRRTRSLIQQTSTGLATPLQRLSACFLQAAVAYHDARTGHCAKARRRLLFVMNEELTVLGEANLAAIWSHRLQQVNNWRTTCYMDGSAGKALTLTEDTIVYLATGYQRRLPSSGWFEHVPGSLAAPERELLLTDAAAQLPVLHVAARQDRRAQDRETLLPALSRVDLDCARYIAAWLETKRQRDAVERLTLTAAFLRAPVPNAGLRSLWIDAALRIFANTTEQEFPTLRQLRSAAWNAVAALPALLSAFQRQKALYGE